MRNFNGFWFLALEFPKGVTISHNFVDFPGMKLCFLWRISKGKVTNLELPGVFFKKVCPQPHLFGFFLLKQPMFNFRARYLFQVIFFVWKTHLMNCNCQVQCLFIMYERYLMHPVGTIIELFQKLQFCLPVNSVFVREMGYPTKNPNEKMGEGVEDIRLTLDLHFHVFHLHLGLG